MVNAYLVPPGLIQDPPASWTDEATICSSYKPHSWEEFEASKAVFASVMFHPSPAVLAEAVLVVELCSLRYPRGLQHPGLHIET